MSPTGNLFLDTLDAASYASISPLLSVATLRQGEIVYEPDEKIGRILFPIGCIVSIVSEMLDGSSVEVGFIGRDGMTGLPIVFGADHSPQRAIVQVPDSALSLNVSDFQAALETLPALRERALTYAHATMTTVARFAACNRLHQIVERLARWLLMAHDRVAGEEVDLTHQFLGQMLGARRSGVTVAAQTLQRAGLIDYSHGTIVICDRRGLEEAACECYRTVSRENVSLCGYSVSKSPAA